MKPCLLSVRAANEYRRRDLLGYLSLRHLLLTSSGKLDRWATDVAAELTLSRTDTPCRHCRVYRGVGERGLIEYRDLHFPGPTEMLAEAALFRACGETKGEFERRPAVFSYVLVEGDSRIGMVAPYFQWWRQRQVAIRNAARNNPDGIVIYFDIKQFYLSLSPEIVQNAWTRAADFSRLGERWRELGAKILNDYARVMERSSGLLMGPMLAHLMGNQVLHSFDTQMMAFAPESYFRYVDDIALVVPADGRFAVSELVRRSLPAGLGLNEDKSLDMGAAEWVRRSDAFAAAAGTRFWVRLVGAIKYFLVARPERTSQLSEMLKQEGFRIPLRDYSNVVRQHGFVMRLLSRLREPWFDRALRPNTPQDVLSLAKEARREIQSLFNVAMDEPLAEKGMARKFQVQRLRYTTSRLLYLAEPDQFATIEKQIVEIRELSELMAIFRALRTCDVTSLLPFSGSVAQAAAQVLLAQGSAVTCTTDVWRPELEFAWAVLEASGVRFRDDAARPSPTSPIVQMARGEHHGVHADAYYREVFALSRVSKIRPAELIAEPLDRDEATTFDALDLLHISS